MPKPPRRTPGAGPPGDLEAAARRVSSCTLCPLSETRTCAVPGRGTGESGIMMVGEAPGRSEDRAGRPFVGAAGRILSAALLEAGIDEKKVYITNVVKCRPPGNRVPRQDEREACRRHLEDEMRALAPDVVCVMGNTAFESLLGGRDITKKRGESFESGGTTYFASLHPAAVIYNRSLEPALYRDMKALAAMAR